MQSLPLVTIGVPNYNYAHYILEALNSVVAQTYRNIELVIVDDFSTDHSIEVIEKWIDNYKGKINVKFIKNEMNVGLTKTCNIILNNANGKYFQPLDADDIIFPDKIQKQVAVLEKSPNTAMVYSNVSVIDESGKIANPDYCKRINYDKDKMPSGKIFNELLIFNFISLPSVLVNTEFAKNTGGFDETLQVQDYYMWLKLSEKYEIKYLSGNNAYYRVHETSMSNLASSSLFSSDSVLRIKFRYFQDASTEIKNVIRKNVQNTSVLLYKHEYQTASEWIGLAFELNPGLKTFIYLLSVKVGIPFSFYEKIKKLLGRS
jgi:glycosyltransferase involved in cell wall biosynthesis